MLCFSILFAVQNEYVFAETDKNVFDDEDNEVATFDMEIDDEPHTLENLTTNDTYLDLKPLASVLKKEKMNDEFDEKAPTSTDNEEKNKRKHINYQSN